MQLTIPGHREYESPTTANHLPRCPIAPQAKLEATVASPARARLTSFEAAEGGGPGDAAQWPGVQVNLEERFF